MTVDTFDLVIVGAGHAGCEVLRRLLGIVSTAELETIDDPERTADFVDMGICGVTTNVPDVMLDAFAPMLAGM